MLEAAAHHALSRRVLELELGGQIGAGGYLGGGWTGAFEPSADAVVGQLGAVADQGAVGFAIGGRAGLVHGKLDDQRHAIFVLVKRGNALGELGGQHGKDFDARIN